MEKAKMFELSFGCMSKDNNPNSRDFNLPTQFDTLEEIARELDRWQKNYDRMGYKVFAPIIKRKSDKGEYVDASSDDEVKRVLRPYQ